MEYALSQTTEDRELKHMRASQSRHASEVIERERGKLLKFIKSRVGEADAEDILQDVFYQFIASMQIEPIERAASWLFHTARNKIIDWYRKIKPASLDKMNTVLSAEGEEESLHRLEDRLNDSNDADTLFLRSVMWEMLDDALDELPENQKEVFVMNEIQGMTFKEISELTGEGVNTLLSRKRYAVLFLRERFKELYDDLPD